MKKIILGVSIIFVLIIAIFVGFKLTSKTVTDTLIYQAAEFDIDQDTLNSAKYFINNVETDHTFTLVKEKGTSIDTSKIKVLNADGTNVPVSVQASGDVIKIQPPKSNYETGRYYRLILNDSFKYSDSTLNDKKDIEFGIKSPEAAKVVYKNNVKKFSNKNIIKKSEDAIEVSGGTAVFQNDILLINYNDDYQEAFVAEDVSGNQIKVRRADFYEPFNELNVTKTIQATKQNFTPSDNVNLTVSSLFPSETVYADSSDNSGNNKNSNVKLSKDKLDFNTKISLGKIAGSDVTLNISSSINLPKLYINHEYSVTGGLTKFDLGLYNKQNAKTTFELNSRDIKLNGQKALDYLKSKGLCNEMSALNKEIKIGKVSYDIVPLVFTVEADIRMYISADLNGKVSVTIVASADNSSGFHLEKSKFRPYKTGKSLDIKLDSIKATGAASAEAGLKFTAGVEVLHLAGVDVNYQFGPFVEFGGEITVTGDDIRTAFNKNETFSQSLDKCIKSLAAKGEAKLYLGIGMNQKASVEFTTNFLKKLKLKEFQRSKDIFNDKVYIINCKYGYKDDNTVLNVYPKSATKAVRNSETDLSFGIKSNIYPSEIMITDANKISISPKKYSGVTVYKNRIYIDSDANFGNYKFKIIYTNENGVSISKDYTIKVVTDQEASSSTESLFYQQDRKYLNSDFKEQLINFNSIESRCGSLSNLALNNISDYAKDDSRIEGTNNMGLLSIEALGLYEIPSKGSNLGGKDTFIDYTGNIATDNDAYLNIVWSDTIVDEMIRHIENYNKLAAYISESKSKWKGSEYKYIKEEVLLLKYCRYLSETFLNNRNQVDGLFSILQAETSGKYGHAFSGNPAANELITKDYYNRYLNGIKEMQNLNRKLYFGMDDDYTDIIASDLQLNYNNSDSN